MNVRVNGVEMTLEDSETLAGLMKKMEIPRKFVAVEYNGELFDGDAEACLLRDGDRLEIVRFVGGG